MTLAGRRARDRRRSGRSPLLGQLLFWRHGNRRIASRPTASAAEDAPRTAGKRAGAKAGSSVLILLRGLGALLVAALLGAAAYGVVYFLLHSPHFALREVRISPTRHVTAEELRKRVALPVGVNLFQLDLAAVKKSLTAQPWLRSVKLHRELPATLRIEVSEHEPVALVCLDSLYLVSDSGEVFKRAAPGEYAHLPVITGFGRAAYLMEPELTRGQIRTALLALSRYQRNPHRPPIGEAHVDHFIGVTLYTDSGVAIRLGQGGDAELDTRLVRFDAVWQALARAGQRPAMLFLDNRAHPDHVTVRLASTTPS
jgi:cell division protein FtsQ